MGYEVNHAIHTELRGARLQLDVNFVEPGCYRHLNLHNLRGLDLVSTSTADSQRIDAISDIYRLFREASPDLKRRDGQRFIVLVVRGNADDSVDDTVYIYRPCANGSIAAGPISEHVELGWLLRSKTDIVPGL